MRDREHKQKKPVTRRETRNGRKKELFDMKNSMPGDETQAEKWNYDPAEVPDSVESLKPGCKFNLDAEECALFLADSKGAKLCGECPKAAKAEQETQKTQPEPDATEAAKPKPPYHEKFTLVPVSELELKPPEYLIKHILETDSLGVMFGDPKTGKSFIALDMACCIATGTPFHGHEIKKPGPVVYIAGEGKNGLKRRLEAWRLEHGLKSLENVYLVTQPQRLTEAECVEIIKGVLGKMPEKPVFVVIDTLARNFGDGDENSTQAMSKYVSATDEIRLATKGAAVMTIHHSGLGDKNRGRGSSALRAAIDCEYNVSKDGGTVRLENVNMKEAPNPDPIAFKTKSVDLGVEDEDGEPVTSLVLERTEYAPKSGEKSGGLSPEQVHLLIGVRNGEKLEDIGARLKTGTDKPWDKGRVSTALKKLNPYFKPYEKGKSRRLNKKGDAALSEYYAQGRMEKIKNAMRGKGQTTGEIAEKTGIALPVVSDLLGRMEKSGKAVSPKDGFFEVPE